MNKLQVIGRNIKVFARQKAPELWFAGGILLQIGGVVSAVVAGTKLERVIKPDYETVKMTKQAIADLKERGEDPAEAKKDLAVAQRRAVKDVTLLMAPVVLLNGLSMVCFSKVYATIKAWNTGLLVAYNGLLDAYMTHQATNMQQLALPSGQNEAGIVGDGADLDGDNVGEIVQLSGSTAPTLYTRMFGPNTSSFYNKDWAYNPEMLLNWIELVRRNAEEKLVREGFLQFSEPLKALGLPCEGWTYVNGWRLSETERVSFGVELLSEDEIGAIRSGKMVEIPLTFNINGLIVDLIDGKAMEDYDERA